MKIILKENLESLGKKGDIVNVAPGYGRNYLIPKKLALEVTPRNIKMIELEQKALRKGLEKEMKSVQSLIERLNQVELKFERKAGEKDSIFGSVSVSDIKEALDKLNFEIEKKRILLDEPIKKLGNYGVSIKVFHDQKAEIKIEVEKEAEEEKVEKLKEKTEPEVIPPTEDKASAGEPEPAETPEAEDKAGTEEIPVTAEEPAAEVEEEPVAEEKPTVDEKSAETAEEMPAAEVENEAEPTEKKAEPSELE